MQKIEQICRRFLWNGNNECSKKALIAWDKICLPKSTGGLNVVDIYTWNKVDILKHFWNLCKKKDRLWVQWVHSYYIKGAQVWESYAPQASWLIQKILKAKQYLEEAGVTIEEFLKGEKYAIKTVYNKMRDKHPKVQWRKLICNNQGYPKWLFILYLALQDRLYTKMRLKKWNMGYDTTCALCDSEEEDIQHLLFKCSATSQIWQQILD
ncbi:uncharacterized protein LOC142180713 [Nicotiana tabacum]|uniref:Uncharacterized protein LOC142180713 n=1 Tax=Nicotiana tabacum TaxID=4097 RepID=A0AC58UI05_TOBAC